MILTDDAIGAVRRPRVDGDRLAGGLLTAAVAALLGTFVLYPLWRILGESFRTPDGFGLANYVRYFGDPKLLSLIWNSLAVTVTATVVTITLAYGFAYAMTRTCMPGKGLFRVIALAPLFAPSLVQALGLVFLFGRNGLINRELGLSIEIYGFYGVVIADILYAFPHAFLVLSAALAVADARLYESAQILGAGGWRIFRTVTLPATRYGLMSASFLVFTIVITDFGNPMVIGGDFNVLATEIYNQVAGQANFSLGAVIGMILLLPAAASVALEKWVSRRQYAVITDQSVPWRPRRRGVADAVAFAGATLIGLAIAAVFAIVVFASFTQLWPYNLRFSLRHYAFDVQNGLAPLWTSIWMSLLAAAIGVVVVVAAAFVVDKVHGPVSRALYFLSVLPAAVPGMVLGLGYILAFNDPANPVNLLYGTLLLLALCNVYHYHAQGFLLASTSLKQISRSFDEASASLGGSLWRTVRRITLPLIWPSVIGVAVFLFMRSMVTLSALIFLFTPSTQVAAISVLLLDDRGATTQAAAFSVCIMAVVVAALLLFSGLLRLTGQRVTLIR